jgi:DNA-binding transcriptional ArsR family regulator
MSRSQRRNDRGRAAEAPRAESPSEPRSSKRKSGLGRVDDGMLFVFSHPLRVRMIAALNEREGSASDLARRLGVKTYHTDYHMKKLREHGCVEVSGRVKVRGLEKTIYRAKVKVDFPEEIWAMLPPSVQKLVVAAVFLTSSSDAQAALLSGSFEERPESHASWTSLQLDEQAWQLLAGRLDQLLGEAEQIQSDAKERLAVSKSAALNVSLNLSSFVLPGDIDPPETRVGADTVREKLRGRKGIRHLPGEGE